MTPPNIDLVKTLVESDGQRTIQDLSDKTGISRSSAYHILTDTGVTGTVLKKWPLTKLLSLRHGPRDLTHLQNERLCRKVA